ncbi:hypothetical protein SAMN04489740_1996 [Arthrobacter alpinus]|uniref:Uncharacterized protein n=1 Tax=Arthrobacter alpinus TaxID=656366 RepID=A0A1H5KFV3_9MICC|nr:hypothetical protein [Arthrobacter alpinus]SEE63693.1 hypothetical protein SAMN04489740_1996 [Arthrobacter alpinus]
MTHKVSKHGRAGSARIAVMALVASIATGVLLAGPATGAENKNHLLELSSDGVNFATDAIPTMFRSTKGYVPGESRQGLIWVRNASKQSAHLSLAVRNTGTARTSVLPGQLHLQAQAQGRSATAVALPAAGGCAPLVDGWPLAAGAVLPLTIDLGLALDSPNSTRKQAADFTLTFVLQEQGPGQLIDPCSGTLNTAPADGVLASVAIGGGAAGAGARGAGTGSAGSGGAEWADGSPVASGHAESEALPEPPHVFRELQSNVEPSTYNPWTWIVLVSGCLYIFAISRKRSKIR